MNRSLNRFSLPPRVSGRFLGGLLPSTARRRLLGALLLGLCGGAHTQSMPLVGVLVSTVLQPLDYLRQGLRELGFVEGQNVVFAFRSADGNPRDLPGLARHLASLKPTVLCCAGPAALLSPASELIR